MIELLIQNPIILLFIVAAAGYGLGSIRFGRSSLGVAAVLFVGLGFGALNAELHIPDIIIFLGLSIFVYNVGLTSGPSFFDAFRRRGLRDIGFVFIMLTISTLLTVGLHFLFQFEATTTAGMFAGASTNTPALAGLLDTIRNRAMVPDAATDLSKLAVVGYSLSYPMGVIGAMIAISLLVRLLKIDFKEEANSLRKEYPISQQIESCSIKITNPDVTDLPIRDLIQKYRWKLVFGRMQRAGKTFLPNWDTEFELNDEITVVGEKEELNDALGLLGVQLERKLSEVPSSYDTSRYFVSNPKVAGERIATLNLNEKFSAIITRVKRGDIDLLASAKTVIELGDQVRVVARKKDLPHLNRLFGNSYEALGRINLLSFGLGMALGLLLGTITFELPGEVNFKLGFAGGPLIVGLILGQLRRTGPIVWTLPYSANLTLQQIGLILMLAGIGINSGHTFANTVAMGGGGKIFLASTIISCFSAISTLWIGHKLLKIPFSILSGMVATQPAILDFATQKSGNKLPTIGFTLMLPVALITKIIYVQFLFVLLGTQ